MIYKFKTTAFQAMRNSVCAECAGNLIGKETGNGEVEVSCINNPEHAGIIMRKFAGLPYDQRLLAALGYTPKAVQHG